VEFHLYALVRQRVAQSYFTTHHEHIAFSDVLVVMVMASSRTSRALFIAGLMILVLACLVRASDNDQPATTTADGATDANSTVRTTIHCQYCDVYVCLSVCLSVPSRISYLENHTAELHQIFCACCMWPRLGPPLAALRYVTYFRFCG